MPDSQPQNAHDLRRRSARNRTVPGRSYPNHHGGQSTSHLGQNAISNFHPIDLNMSQGDSRSDAITSRLSDHQDSSETVQEDDLCPICQLILYRPVTTRCNHTLCESCMATWAEVSITASMEIVDVDEPPVPFDAVSGIEASCPMCRTRTSANLNQARIEDLKAKYPVAYAEREAEENAPHTDSNDDEIQTLTINIGNRHELITPAADGRNNGHKWTFFLRPSRTDIIEEVHILLHPTFRPSRIIRTRAPYEVVRIGWGYFIIVAYVILKPGYSWVSQDAEDSLDGAEKGMLGLEWTLDFERFGGKGSMARLKLKVKNQRNWQDVSEEEEEDERERARFMRQYDMDGRYEPDEMVD